MARQFRLTFMRRVANWLISAAVRLGLGPGTMRLLTVRGRKTGQHYETPVNLVEREGQQYLVAPYGEVSWVRNARATGEVTLSRGRRSESRSIDALSAAEAAPILKEYWRRNSIARPYFDAASEDDDEAFFREANRHPTFRLD